MTTLPCLLATSAARSTAPGTCARRQRRQRDVPVAPGRHRRDQPVRLRRFDPLTGASTHLLTRPNGTRASTMLVSDLGDMA